MDFDFTATLAVIMLFLFPIFFFFNSTFKFYTKIVIHYTNMMLSSVLPIPLAIFSPRDPLNTRYCSFILRHLSKVFDITWEIRGLENLKSEEAAIVVCNHQTSLDVIAMMEMWPKLHRCVSTMKKELLFTGPFAFMAWLSNSIFLDRGNSTKARTALNNAIHKLALNKTKIWLFPEGTRNDKGSMLPFKKGAFHLAIQAQIPVLPLVVSPYNDFYDIGLKKFDNGGKVIITALPPVPTAGLTVDDIDSLIQNVRSQMLETFENYSKKPELNNHVTT